MVKTSILVSVISPLDLAQGHQGSLDWGIAQIALACGHVCEELFQVLIDRAVPSCVQPTVDGQHPGEGSLLLYKKAI